MFTEILRFDDLNDEMLAGWQGLTDFQSGYSSPFFHPHFTRIVSECRDDIFVIVHGQGDELEFVLPIQKRGHAALAVGAPFSDYHGPVMSPEFCGDVHTILKTVGLSSYAFTSLYDPKYRFETHAVDRDGTFVCDISAGADSYFEEQRQLYARHAKKMRRLTRKIEREVGQLDFSFEDSDEDSLSLLLEWKRWQYRTTGRHDVLAPKWVVNMLHRLWKEGEPGCFGAFHTLKHEGRLVAGEFNLLSKNTIHGWIPAFDREYWSYSPGYLLQDQIITHAADRGYAYYDLGVSAGHYKKYYANFQIPVLRGHVRTGGLNAKIDAANQRLWHSVEQAKLPAISALAGKVRRRYDMISAVETSFSGRMKGIALAAEQMLRKPSVEEPVLQDTQD